MKLNENTAIVGEKVVLVPYKKHHVNKYNFWMQNIELQQLTASEPLTLEQEYEMQDSWHKDAEKLTFIILDRKKWKPQRHEDTTQSNTRDDENLEGKTEECCMIGDVNLFCTDCSWRNEVEISLMVAEKSYQRHGYGTEAAKLVMQYAIKHLHPRTFNAKIGMDNVPSTRMFEKLNFKQVAKSDVFRELTLQYSVPTDEHKFVQTYCEISYTVVR